ncbi:uncharacterized protein LOC131930825 [Physella acuta]|uniref:uncharacterized protein LOC131930825 n=1 Tax=Physella acuta TaxID=109671 RepID=UPI0027DC0C98|nr:uncharacterized protein LOC131930825 [Physella acuta]
MLFTKRDTIKFIEEVRNRRCLWDLNSADYSNRKIKRNNILELAAVFDMGYKDVERKINSLKSQFFREHRKVESSKLTGMGEVFRPKWYGYDLLLFLVGLEQPYATLIKILTGNNSTCIDKKDFPTISISGPTDNFNHCDQIIRIDEVHLDMPEIAEQPQKRKVVDTTESASENTMSKMRKLNYDNSLNHADDHLSSFAKYIEAELTEIKNNRRLLLLKKKIQDLIFETKLEEM